ncbi:MAG: hypothetical protein FWG99_10020 [Treponema sp.]|nr:hypothetical protein [Treponema sp.]
MKKVLNCTFALYIFFLVSGSLYGVGEKTISLGSSFTWRLAESRTGLIEAGSIRPNPVLMLSAEAAAATSLDLSVSFNEGDPRLYRDSLGHYSVSASPELEAVEQRFARTGTGAALFGGAASNGSPVTIEPRSRSALFAPGSQIGDFSIEFWLYPLNMENGEQILSWVSTRQNSTNRGAYSFQRILCAVARNRLQWSFIDFFTSVDRASNININLAGNTPVIPKTWSHHLIRFDSDTGLLEYLVNGRSEDIVYATSSGREAGEVYAPVAGEAGSFVLGGQFMGIMDEFNIYNAFYNNASMEKYTRRGGRTETRAIDLGESYSSIIRIDASGGRTSIRGTRASSEFRENGRFRFSDDSEMQFFIRTSDNPYRWDNDWYSFIPGAEIPADIHGRYVQLAVDFYPSSDGETSPYLEGLFITYIPAEPPLPPQLLTATAVDGGVQLRWRNSPNPNTTGYLIYYSDTRGEYFGEDAALGPSPIDAGRRNSLVIDGLRNGTLYYFRIAAYDHRDAAGSTGYHVGEFSREVTARPLAGLSLQALGIMD